MSSIDINKLSCGGSGYIEQVIEIEIYSQNSKRSFSPGEIPVFT
jgi:hypothetical protein